MKIRKTVIILLMVTLLAFTVYAPAIKAEENTSGTLLSYKFTDGETRQYRLTMTLVDGTSLNAELVMNLTATVRAHLDGSAAVEVTPSLISFKPDSPDGLASEVIGSSLCETRTIEVNSLGQVKRAEPASNLIDWVEPMQISPNLFCALFTATVFGQPTQRALPFWVQYSGKAVNNGETWQASSESGQQFENLNCSWRLKETNANAATVEQLFGPYQLYLSFDKSWLELAMMYTDSEDFRFKPRHSAGPVVRKERRNAGATITVDLATGWITRYECTNHVSGEMTVKKPGLFTKKSTTPVDSTITTVLELM